MPSSDMTARDAQQFEASLIASIEATEALLESELALSQSFVDGLNEPQSVSTAAIEDSIITQVENAVVVPDDPTTRREIVFISTDVYDYEYLSLNLPESVQIALITSDRDGMEQIAEALRGESNVDAIHIISHCRAGELFIGSAAVNTASLSNEYADELAIIRAALSDDADVLVYGCSVANGDIGQNFIDALAVGSGADVAASTNDTGSEAKGGDWNLEASVGTVTTQSIQAKSWDGLLAPITITPVTGSATAAGNTLANNILGNGITLNSATFAGDNSQAGTFTSATGYTPEWLGYGSGILLSTGTTSQVVGPNTAEGSSVNAPGGFTDADLGLLGGGTSNDSASLTLTFTPNSNRVTLQFTFGSDEYNEYVYSAFNDAMGIWVNGQQMAILPTGETISVNSVNQAATFNPANGNQSRDPFPGNGTFDSASPSLYKSNSVASGTYNTGMDGFTVTMSIIADVTAGVSNTIKIGITDIQDSSWDSWLFIRSASFEAETIAYTDNVTTTVNTPVTIDAKANDWDLQGHALTITHIADNGSYTFNPGTAFDDLAVDQTRTTSVTYSATDNQGGASSTTLTITVTGTNDGPTSTALSNRTNADGSAVSVNVSGNFADADVTDTLTFSASGLPAGLSIHPTTGIISGTIANNASVSGPFTVMITATDPHGLATSQSFTWSVTNPVPTATADTGSTSENSTTSGNVISNDTDPDNDVLTVAAVNGNGASVGNTVTGTNGGSFTINSDGTYTFNPGASFDDLAVSQSRSTSVAYTATDSQGSSSTTLTITVNGTNDAPVSTAIANQSSSDGQTISLSIAGNFSDPDTSDVLAFTASGLPSGLSINSSTGVISGTIANNASVTGPYSVTVTATDNASATTSQTFTWTVTNPAPTATNDIATIASNATASGNVLTNDADPDNDSLSVSSVNGSPANVGNSVSGSNGGTFSIAANGAFTFNPGTDFDSLGAGATATTTVTYQMTDSQGGFSTATVTITVTGINSAPVSTPITAQSIIDGGSVTLNVSGNFSDPDAGDALTFSASSLPPGLSINSTTGIISGTIDNNASVGGPYSVTITATDIAGATTSRTFTWTVTNPAPAATNDATATTENVSSSGNVLTNDSDSDGDAFTVSAVNGVAGDVGNGVVGSNGGTFTINATGGYTFVPGTSFDDLAAG